MKKDLNQSLWNKKAKQYYESQIADRSQIVTQVLKHLNKKDILRNRLVLDVGGGTGRYAIPISKYAKHVTLLDVSEEMIKYAKMHAQNHQCDNLDYVHANWSDYDLVASDMLSTYDVVFTSMSYATRTLDGIYKMMEASKKWCVLNQFIKMQDTVIKAIKQKLSLSDNDPHEDVSYVKTVMNELWDQDKNPEIYYSTTKTTMKYSIAEAKDRYQGRFLSLFEEKSIDFNSFIESLANENQFIEVKNHTIMATIIWNKNR